MYSSEKTLEQYTRSNVPMISEYHPTVSPCWRCHAASFMSERFGKVIFPRLSQSSSINPISLLIQIQNLQSILKGGIVLNLTATAK